MLSYTVYWDYITTHNVPFIGSWLKKGEPRPVDDTLLNSRYARKLDGTMQVHTKGTMSWATKAQFENRFDGAVRVLHPGGLFGGPLYEPNIPPPPGATSYPDIVLTRWQDLGLTDVALWNQALGGQENKQKMLKWEITDCPPELRSFYCPEEKKEDTTFISNSSPAPVPAPSTMNVTPALTTLGIIPATMALANQPAPTPANVVANNNVTQGSNNAGAAPSAQNGSVSPGSADVGSASQTGSDVKSTNVKHDAKSKAHSNEPLKT